MHQISRVTIENFKSIINGTFPLAPYTPLVGYNNAGKTNILQAVNWLIKKSSLPATDFYDQDKPVVVTVKVSGVNAAVLAALGDTHRPKIEPLVIDETIHIRREQKKPGDPIKELPLQVLKRNEDGAPSWEVNPAGIDAAISYLFPEPIFIGAMENATEDVGKFAAGTTIGKLIKEIIDPVTEVHSVTVTEALAEIGKKLSADSNEKDEHLLKLDMQIQKELGQFFPGVRAKTHIPTPEFGDFLKGATIRIFEEGFGNDQGRDASSFGHGAQRSVQIALIKCLSDMKRNNAANLGRTTLLLIDEPELYLHPQAVELIRASLSRLSGEGYQILFTTHSPAMISVEDAPNALLIRRNPQNGTNAYPRIQDAVKSAIVDAQQQSETLFTLTHSAKVLFSEKVVLVEGATERRLLPKIFLDEFGHTLAENKLGLVDLGSVNDIPNALEVLNSMGIPSLAVVDLDFAFRGAIKHGFLSDNHAGILGCRAILQRLANDRKCTLEGGLPKTSGGVTAAAAFAKLAIEPDAVPHIQSIHNDLKKRGIWCWR